MPHPCPHHCPSPGGSGVPVLAILGVLAAAAAARAVIHAAELAAEVLVITAAAVLGLAVLAAAAWAAVRVHCWRARRSAAALPARAPRELPGAPQQAIEPPRQAIYGPAAVNRARARRVH